MDGAITFDSTTPRDMVVRLDGEVIGHCSRNQWRGGTTMLYRWRADLKPGYRVADPETAGTALDGLEAPTKDGIKRLVVEAVRAAPAPAAAPAPR